MCLFLGGFKKLVQCPQCGHKYRWKKTLLRHLRDECNKPPQFQCKYCLKFMSRRWYLEQHIRKQHSDCNIDYTSNPEYENNI